MIDVIDVHQEYTRRLEHHRAAVAEWSRRDARIAWVRLAVFGVGVGIAWGARSGAASWWWLALPVGAFLWLVRWHDGVIREHDRAAASVEFYERAMHRLSDTWSGLGATGSRFLDPNHLYAADLDLFGEGSLFQLLSLARTRSGEETLATWLTTPAPPQEIRARQGAIDELATALDLRETLWNAGAHAATALHQHTLREWASAPETLPRWLQWVSAALTVAIAATAAWAMTGGGTGPLITVLFATGLVLYRLLGDVVRVLHTAGGWSRELDALGNMLTALENHTFTAPRLRDLIAQLDKGGPAPSRVIRRLHRLSEMHDWQHNVVFAAIATPLLYGVHLALAMERWRRAHGPHVGTWLDGLGQIEALNSLAAYRVEHPGDTFPVIEDGELPRLVGVGLGHPLLPSNRMVRNDVRLDDSQCLLVVSGSNMSGKSTWLRTVGVNVVLAQLGAPVRAASLTLTPLAIGATLRVQDSLQEGRSRFFAEISRVKDIADRSRSRPPVLFLLDELFHGTNSHDRLVGASGVLRALLDRGAIGLITTHDMALAGVADRLAPRAINVHFDDRFEDGEMRFDYTMKPGPVTSSNALALMRTVGLDVDSLQA